MLRGVWDGTPFDYDGRFFRTEGAALPPLLAGQRFPEVFFSGSSGAAVAAAGAHADYYLSWLEPFADLRAKFDGVREHSAKLGRLRSSRCASTSSRGQPRKRRGRDREGVGVRRP